VTSSLARAELFADRSLVGTVFCRAYSRRVDEWLAALYDSVGAAQSGMALAAVGGYGRAELSPQSDIDVVLVHERNADIEEVASGLWYPIWDEGLKLGHSVRTQKEALTLAKDDLDTATSLLSIRHLAGDRAVTRRLADAARTQWQRMGRTWLPVLRERTDSRHRDAGEVAFLLEPDLKAGRGGLRDVHAMQWAAATDVVHAGRDDPAVIQAYETILAGRVELHRSTGRANDVLLLEEQDAVAEALSYPDADALMSAVAAAAKVISWTSDEAWHGISSDRRRRWFRPIHRESIGPGVERVGRLVQLTADADLTDPVSVLRVSELAARHDLGLDRDALDRLVVEAPDLPTPWPDEARTLFEKLLLHGFPAIPVMESLDHVGLLVRLIPEWEPCRSKPQRNAYHRFTVDRHLLEAAAQAARVVDRVDDPGLLVVGALLHDIGKGYPGDHTEVGVEMILAVAGRMGYPADEIAVLVAMCEHHLLLPDVATRRDVDDDSTVTFVAEQVGSARVLKLLDALTEADSIATGPAAWSRWKAGLVRDLVHRADSMLAIGDVGSLPRRFPTDEQLALTTTQRRQIIIRDDTVTVATPDRPALLWRVAGSLALHGLDVLQADVHSENGMALQVFRVEPGPGGIDETSLRRDIEAALDGRLAIFARLDDRTRTYRRRRSAAGPDPVVPMRVSFDNESAANATVIEVGATDSLGLLCHLAHAMAQLDLDISRSKVQTLGDQAVDSFYVHDSRGAKITDADHIDEIRRAIIHSLEATES